MLHRVRATATKRMHRPIPKKYPSSMHTILLGYYRHPHCVLVHCRLIGIPVRRLWRLGLGPSWWREGKAHYEKRVLQYSAMDGDRRRVLINGI